MLILTRKIGEEITIGEQVTVKVLAIQEGQVKIGIVAPRELKIFRREIYEQIQQQNVAATKIEKSSVAKAAGMLSESRRQTGTRHPQKTKQ
jgi:carbon storage regulator